MTAKGGVIMTKYTYQDVQDFLASKGVLWDGKFIERKYFDKLIGREVDIIGVKYARHSTKYYMLLDVNEMRLKLYKDDCLAYDFTSDWIKFAITKHPENASIYATALEMVVEKEQTKLGQEIGKLNQEIALRKKMAKPTIDYWQELVDFAKNMQETTDEMGR